ncbi:hypothetical protein D9756_010447 [Leucocoprinus leucothites]|uniref:DUF4939 domain-containing protein n=1 Tax=Leucocoprinus leucothites TaxID=201217 RepID=A0A8H5CRY0_9AGAR|nr:hypothetical protein D9756_011265 [Leucoagaricus leucothites]KAF5348276.1 hypothetical protein D9756_010447 [Leucoagaricus leucothites]
MVNTRTIKGKTSTVAQPERKRSHTPPPVPSSSRLTDDNSRISIRARRSRRLNPNLPETPRSASSPPPPPRRFRNIRSPRTPAPPGGLPSDRNPSDPSEPGDSDGPDYADNQSMGHDGDDEDDEPIYNGSPGGPGDPDDNDPEDPSHSSDDEPLPPRRVPHPRAPRQDPNNDRLAEALGRLADNLDHQAAAQANQTRTNKARLPDTFSGSDPEKLNTFLIQCRLYFRANPTQFQHDNQKVDFAMTYLTGVALDWFEVGLTQEEQGVFHDWFDDWNAFVRELRTHFGIANPKGEAAEMLDTLRMKPGDKIATFNVEFLKHASQLGWNDEVLCHRYYKGLPNRIQDPLSTREQGKPTTFEEMHRLAIVYDGRYWERDRERVRARAAEKDAADSLNRKQPNKPSTSNPSNPNPSRGQSQPGNNNNNNNRGGNNSNSNNNSNRNQSQAPTTKSNTPAPSTSSTQRPTPKFDLSSKLGQNGKLTPEERKRRLDEDLCLFCGGKGHKVENCHKKQNRAKIRKVEAAPSKDSEKSPEK